MIQIPTSRRSEGKVSNPLLSKCPQSANPTNPAGGISLCVFHTPSCSLRPSTPPSAERNARFARVGPSVCDGSLLNVGRSDIAPAPAPAPAAATTAAAASSDTDDSRACASDELDDALEGLLPLLPWPLGWWWWWFPPLREEAQDTPTPLCRVVVALDPPPPPPPILPRPFLGKLKTGVFRASTAASYERKSSAGPCSVVRTAEDPAPFTWCAWAWWWWGWRLPGWLVSSYAMGVWTLGREATRARREPLEEEPLEEEEEEEP